MMMMMLMKIFHRTIVPRNLGRPKKENFERKKSLRNHEIDIANFAASCNDLAIIATDPLPTDLQRRKWSNGWGKG